MADPNDPCGCEDSELPFTTTTGSTFCDGDRRDNVWVEGADENGQGGVCLIDTLDKTQIVNILKKDDRARADLKRVTTNADLQNLADTVPRFETTPEGDKLQSEINADSMVMYTHFRGQPPFNQ